MVKDISQDAGLTKQHLTSKLVGVEMMAYVIVGLILLLAVIVRVLLKANWSETRRKPVYVCDRCNEHHCECTKV